GESGVILYFGAISPGLRQPTEVADEVGCHSSDVSVLEGQILPGSGSQDCVARVPHFCLGLKNSTTAVAHKLRAGDEGLGGPRGMEVPHIQLGAVGESFRSHCASPGH